MADGSRVLGFADRRWRRGGGGGGRAEAEGLEWGVERQGEKPSGVGEARGSNIRSRSV
jgi:hypothetical protein